MKSLRNPKINRNNKIASEKPRNKNLDWHEQSDIDTRDADSIQSDSQKPKKNNLYTFYDFIDKAKKTGKINTDAIKREEYIQNDSLKKNTKNSIKLEDSSINLNSYYQSESTMIPINNRYNSFVNSPRRRNNVLKV